MSPPYFRRGLLISCPVRALADPRRLTFYANGPRRIFCLWSVSAHWGLGARLPRPSVVSIIDILGYGRVGAAFGHISADLRLQAWTFELPQSHSFHRNVNIDIIGSLHHVLRQHDKNHHANITQLKSDGSNWVKKGLKRGLKQSRNRYWPIHRRGHIVSYWANL